MNKRQVVSRLVVPLLLFVAVFAIVFLARQPRAVTPAGNPGFSSVAAAKPGNVEVTELPEVLPPDRQPATRVEVSSIPRPSSDTKPGATENAVPSTYAPADRWRKTAMPCWGLRGTAPEDFVVNVDTSFHTEGKSSASLESIGNTFGWGTLYQFADAEDFRGKRIEFTADIRTMAVQRGANLLVRADDARGNAVAMDNMWYSSDDQGGNETLVYRQITGDTDWITQRIVLDIPANAAVISYGVALDGPGKVWIDNARIEPAAADTRATARVLTESELAATGRFVPAGNAPVPRNLDFEQKGAIPGCE